MPSIADLIFLALLFTLTSTSLSMRLLGDAGIGWHIRTGQIILTTHSIPHEDPFSTQIHKPWVAWEWLYDVLVGALEKSAGLNGVVWLTALLIGVVFGVTFRLLMVRGTNLPIALLLVLLAISASMIHFLARPHVLSWLFTLAWFWILSATERGSISGKWLWALPWLMPVWVNVHGGFVFGFVLIGIFWLASLWTWFRTDEARLEDALERIVAGKRTRTLFFVGLASAAASLVNPYGWNLHAHIYSYLTNQFLMDHIEEFQSPNFHGAAQKCFLVLLLIAIAALAARGRRLRLSEILVALVIISSALYSSRNIPVASILLVIIIGPVLPAVAMPFFHKMTRLESCLRGHLWPVVGAALSVGIALNGGRVGSMPVMDAHFDPRRMPVAAVNFLASQNARAFAARAPRLAEAPQCGPPVAPLAPDYWGGYLVYRLYPEERVPIDDRHDFYGEYLMKRYLTTIHLDPGWEKFVDLQSCILLPRNAALTQALMQTAAWNAVYSDETAVIFVRANWPLEHRDKAPNP